MSFQLQSVVIKPDKTISPMRQIIIIIIIIISNSGSSCITVMSSLVAQRRIANA